MFTEMSPSSMSVSPEVCSRAAEAAESVSVGSSARVSVSLEVCSMAAGVAESVSVGSSVSSSIRPEVCSRAVKGSGSVVVEPVEVSISTESVASTAANVVGEKVELRKRNLQVEERGSSPSELDEEECADLRLSVAVEGNKQLELEEEVKGALPPEPVVV